MKLMFYAPDPVPNGDTVTLDFDVNVATTGSFGFRLAQKPAPEPATIVLLGLGSMALLRRKTRVQCKWIEFASKWLMIQTN